MGATQEALYGGTLDVDLSWSEAQLPERERTKPRAGVQLLAVLRIDRRLRGLPFRTARSRAGCGGIERRPALVPVGRHLVGMRDPQHRGLVGGPAGDLHRER